MVALALVAVKSFPEISQDLEQDQTPMLSTLANKQLQTVTKNYIFLAILFSSNGGKFTNKSPICNFHNDNLIHCPQMPFYSDSSETLRFLLLLQLSLSIENKVSTFHTLYSAPLRWWVLNSKRIHKKFKNFIERDLLQFERWIGTNNLCKCWNLIGKRGQKYLSLHQNV